MESSSDKHQAVWSSRSARACFRLGHGSRLGFRVCALLVTVVWAEEMLVKVCKVGTRTGPVSPTNTHWRDFLPISTSLQKTVSVGAFDFHSSFSKILKGSCQCLPQKDSIIISVRILVLIKPLSPAASVLGRLASHPPSEVLETAVASGSDQVVGDHSRGRETAVASGSDQVVGDRLRGRAGGSREKLELETVPSVTKHQCPGLGGELAPEREDRNKSGNSEVSTSRSRGHGSRWKGDGHHKHSCLHLTRSPALRTFSWF